MGGIVKVEVERDDLLDVLRAVPGWVPMGAPGDGDWTPESLSAKERIMQAQGWTVADMYPDNPLFGRDRTEGQ